jgi:predicted permease
MNLLRDLRYGLRTLATNPAFAAAALAVMTLGVGSSTAVFSVLRGVMLAPLPYRDPQRLVLVRADLPGYAHEAALTGEEYFALRDRTDVFEQIAILNPSEGNLTDADIMAAVTAASVSDGFFDTLGVQPVLGRAVSRRDIGPFVNAIDLGYEAWQRHFHGDPRIVGRTIEVNNLPMTVAGVMPRDFRLYLGAGVAAPTRIDVFYPRARGYDDDPFRGQIVFGRLRGGTSLGSARAAVATTAEQLVATHPSSYLSGAVRLSIAPIDEDVVSDVKPALMAMAGSVAFVLLVACANLANLLLARASARTREIAVRIAVGATRMDILRQLLAEGLVIGGLGAAGGLLLAQWAIWLLLRLAPAALPRREGIHLDLSAALFAAIVSLVCALAVSLVPAWQAARQDVGGWIKRDASPRAARVTRGALVAAQLALSLMLLVGAGLMVRAFVNLRTAPLGFDPHGVVTMGVALQMQRFGTGNLEESRRLRLAFYTRLTDAVGRLPGVERAGVGLPAPFGSGGTMAQRYSASLDQPERPAEGIIALSGYLETLRVPLLSGRYFTSADDDRAAIIVDERLAGELWPGQPAPGRRLLMIYNVGEPRWAEVVGVVAHVQDQDLRHRGLPQIWVSYGVRAYAGLDLVVRGADPATMIPAIQETVRRLGAGRPVHDIRLLDESVADASADTRFAVFVLGAFAVLAVILAGIGVYGVIAYATARRTREIALRIALGADARRIVSLILRDGLAWTALGLAAGVAGSLGLSRYLGSLLFNVGARDPLTFCTVALVLTAVTLMATALPALRAVRVDPMLALKAD